MDHYHLHGRTFPWRETSDPYAITVSEFMLQQTQTERVVPKYLAFLDELPTWNALARANQAQVLRLWQGLGYNRRALNLQASAQAVVERFGGEMPNDTKDLLGLPGIGPYTASAIEAFAYNKPVVMIETNIRRVYIHHFFADRTGVHDSEILPHIEETLDQDNPRIWYYALMDYGAYLGRIMPNPNRRSKHYARQSAFQGSRRQVRGMIVRFMLEQPGEPLQRLVEREGLDPELLRDIVTDLRLEGFSIPEELTTMDTI